MGTKKQLYIKLIVRFICIYVVCLYIEKGRNRDRNFHLHASSLGIMKRERQEYLTHGFSHFSSSYLQTWLLHSHLPAFLGSFQPRTAEPQACLRVGELAAFLVLASGELGWSLHVVVGL